MNGVEINTRAYVATRLLLRWDYLYAVTLKTKVFGDYNHARLEVSWITSTRGLLLRGYTGAWSRTKYVDDKKISLRRRSLYFTRSRSNTSHLDSRSKKMNSYVGNVAPWIF